VRGRTEAPRAFSEALAEGVRQALARRKNVEEKKMFGGTGFRLNGNLLVGVRKDSLLVRLGPEKSDEALKAAHVSPLKPLQNGPRGP
jgi:TfoX/Sxy family transcriptional regulator of competence genes